ncbi:unnamed protein product, partial [Symbiodinium microadriaticum]
MPEAARADVLQLRCFLRQRCGSLKAAFAALDSSDTGQLKREEFEMGLRKLGFRADVAAVFRSMDPNSSGLVSLKAFVTGLMGEPGIESAPSRNLRHSYHAGMSTPRLQESGPAPAGPTLLQKAPGPHHAGPKPTIPSKPEGEESLATLGARVVQLELQLAREQQSRADMERRLHLELERLEQLIRDVPSQEPRPAWQGSLQLSVSSPYRPQRGRIENAEGSTLSVATSLSEKCLADPPISGASAKAASPGPAREHQEVQKIPRLHLTPRTLLRQENLALREQILTMREQAVAAKERERSFHASGPPSSRSETSGGISGHKVAGQSASLSK